LLKVLNSQVVGSRRNTWEDTVDIVIAKALKLVLDQV